jgi:hypothetical protein
VSVSVFQRGGIRMEPLIFAGVFVNHTPFVSACCRLRRLFFLICFQNRGLSNIFSNFFVETVKLIGEFTVLSDRMDIEKSRKKVLMPGSTKNQISSLIM